MTISTALGLKLAFFSAIIVTGAFSEAAYAFEGMELSDPPVDPNPERIGPELRGSEPRYDNIDVRGFDRDHSQDFNREVDLGRWEEVIDDGRFTFYESDSGRWSGFVEYDDDMIDTSRLQRHPNMNIPDSEGGRVGLRYRW